MDVYAPKAALGSWVQTERALHESWYQFLSLKGAVAASRVMHVLLSRVRENNALVISQKNLAHLLEYDYRTVRRAVAMLREHNWIDVRQIGERGTVNAYIINSRLAWSGSRDGIRYSTFNATVITSSDEQPNDTKPDNQEPLHRFPRIFADESQLPAGDGLPPVSSPSLPGMEHPLPAIEHNERETREEAASFDKLIDRLIPSFSETQD